MEVSLSGAGSAGTQFSGELRHHLRSAELGHSRLFHSHKNSNKLSPFRSYSSHRECFGGTRFNPKSFLSLSSSFPRFSTPVFANEKESENSFAQNVSEEEDTDEMFDELFERYGKVVYTRNDKKSPTDEVNDDAESLSFAVAMAKVASDVKGGDIKVLFVKPLVYWTRFFIITTAFSRPQIDAIRSRMRDMAEKQYGKISMGDTKPNSWTLLDFGDVVVHIFLPEQRDYYNLEEFYANATLINLPFDNQPPFRQ